MTCLTSSHVRNHNSTEFRYLVSLLVNIANKGVSVLGSHLEGSILMSVFADLLHQICYCTRGTFLVSIAYTLVRTSLFCILTCGLGHCKLLDMGSVRNLGDNGLGHFLVRLFVKSALYSIRLQSKDVHSCKHCVLGESLQCNTCS